jgi:hypothetical protein
MGPDGPVRVVGGGASNDTAQSASTTSQGLPYPGSAAAQHPQGVPVHPAPVQSHPVGFSGDAGGRHAVLHAADSDHAHRYGDANVHAMQTQPGAVVYSSGNGSSSSTEQEQTEQGMMFGSIYSSTGPMHHPPYPHPPGAPYSVTEVAPPPAGPLAPAAMGTAAAPYVPYMPPTQLQPAAAYGSGPVTADTSYAPDSQPQPQPVGSSQASASGPRTSGPASQPAHARGRAGGRRDEECRFFLLGNCRYGDRWVVAGRAVQTSDAAVPCVWLGTCLSPCSLMWFLYSSSSHCHTSSCSACVRPCCLFSGAGTGTATQVVLHLVPT